MSRKDRYLFGFQVGLSVVIVSQVVSINPISELPLIVKFLMGFVISLLIGKLFKSFFSEEFRQGSDKDT
ncbi:hypothetical protein [Alkalibacterium olivapovliticus]|uniref:Uncharacterized protein n=1 Tax=Alkalibacterium olivapovliticus TaxID=99907 RepID=A0A2T0W902_9LACT|nr:hypothetical protein [Alkalibacterium olivapovliticus]PRY83106.1 hypothetical protein CLV38_10610 [Alkalibacterium olivapovliticus]